MVVLVTGGNGQLGQALQSVAGNYPSIDFVFCNSSQLDITNLEQCRTVFNQFKPNFCINTAAYTAVDKAESEPEKAFDINVKGTENLAKVCKEFDVTLLHISTDFVFSGDFSTPLEMTKGYTETDKPNPTGVYGLTKLQGEQSIQNIWEKHFIIRTSWVYSEFGNNFMKTMLRLASERESLSVVKDQIGTPTYAVDLANALINIISHAELVEASIFGIYNFSNEGQCSWYEFAKEIFAQKGIKINLNPIPTSAYPTPAKRPGYSVLDKTKIKTIFGLTINNWEDSLSICLSKI
ncbi:MAG: dTDP-4-dehydrorhamnose reductase [Flavobacterium haoranii]